MATSRGGYLGILCIVLHCAAWLAVPARAADTWGGSLAVTTDYIYRGISQTRGKPAVQGGAYLKSPAGWSLGAWASSVDLNRGEGATVEIDLHAAQAWTLGEDWQARLGFTHYLYPNDSAWLDYDYDELSATLSYQQRVAVTVAWSPNTSRSSRGMRALDKRALSYELTLLQPLGAYWSVYAGAGYSDLHQLFATGYWYWNSGLAFTWDAVQLDVSHIDTDSTAESLFGYHAAGSRWTAALSWRF